jgi:ABC-type nickel/cobalt efflux system permease component RcnA
MTFAVTRGVPEAGAAFALTMFAGVALGLASVTLCAVAFRASFARLVAGHPLLLERLARLVAAAVGLALIAVAINEIVNS